MKVTHALCSSYPTSPSYSQLYSFLRHNQNRKTWACECGYNSVSESAHNIQERRIHTEAPKVKHRLWKFLQRVLGLWLGMHAPSSTFQITHRSQRELPPREPFQYDADHYRQLATCWSLFTVLYLPESGMDDAPVGDDLMEWLNVHYVEPPTEEGTHLSALDHPWEDENFWPYLTRCAKSYKKSDLPHC